MTVHHIPISSSNQIAFRYRTVDSATGITRETAKRLADYLGMQETQVIHQAKPTQSF